MHLAEFRRQLDGGGRMQRRERLRRRLKHCYKTVTKQVDGCDVILANEV